MNKPHKIYTEDEIRKFGEDRHSSIKYTVFNPITDSEEYYFHDNEVASIEIYSGNVGTRYESNGGMCDYRFPLENIIKVELISYEELKYAVTPADLK